MAGDMILDNIEEFLFDEDRVVSYKWLSRTLSLHVNHAKRKLEEFADIWREKEKLKPITLTFFISGTQETTSGNELNKVAIVKEEDLENVKKSLKKTLCEHIYSIQKTTLKDTSALYQADFDNTKNNLLECNKYSAISCEAAKARSKDSLPAPQIKQVSNGRHQDKSKEDKVTPKSVSSSNDRKKKQGLAAFMTKPKTESKPAAKPEEQPKDTVVKQKNSAPKVGSLMHAFQSSQKTSKASPPKEKSQESSKKQEAPSEVNAETTSRNTEDTTSKNTEDTTSKNTEDTTSKNTEKPSKTEESTKTEETTSGKTEDKTSSTTSTSTSKKDEERKTKQSPKTASLKDITKKKEEKVESKKGSKRNISKTEPDSKESGSKRRRVIRMEESSSSEDEESDVDLLEEEEEAEMDDTPIPPTPEPRSRSSQEEKRKSPSEKEEATGRKGRKKVWKKKRYLDEEGCMVTEKVFESESDGGSEGEDQTAPSAEKSSGDKKETSPSSGTNKSSPPSSGRKQTALTSFFKKR